MDSTTPVSRWRSPLGVFMLIAGAAGVYYLLTEHLTHFAQAIPYLILLACPLMHVFGHGHGHGHRHRDARDAQPQEHRHVDRR